MNTGASFPELVVARERVLHFQRKLHEWASIEHEPLDVLMESRVRGNSHARFYVDRTVMLNRRAFLLLR